MPLLESDVLKIAPEPGEPAADRAPDWVAEGTPEPLRSQLVALLGEDRVLSRASDLIRYASDASPYRMLPKAVVMAKSDTDIGKVIAFGRENGIGVTFRAGGSSLNGQSQSEGILVDVRRHFGGIEVLDEGRSVSVAPGAMMADVNRVLAPYGHKLGPDPASMEIATVGGVVANNSGGMKCGTKFDSYSTVTGMSFILPSGTVVDSTAPDAEAKFAEAEPELAAGLLKIREEILADEELAEKIRRKFEIKNTTGYRLCAFLDAETPVEIYRRLMVGSEGTLGFISRVIFDTRPIPKKTTLAWIHFPDIPSAIDPVPELVAAGASAVEVMVAPALIVASWNMPGAPDHWKELDPASAALLVEFGGDDGKALDKSEKKAMKILDGRELIREVEFSRDEEIIEINWRVREGLHGLVGKMRLPGTALIVEDVCVPPARIAEGAEELRALLTDHGFLGGVAGHASAGNLHFMLTPDFSKPEDLERYEAFMGKLVELICNKYEGSLKAEHGTGINMAPYVELEWGEKATGDDVAGQGTGRSRRRAQPRSRAQPRPELPPAEPDDHPADRGGRHRMRRVRLLRAGLPEPQSDHHPAPADRAAAGDGPPGRRHPGPPGAARGVRVRRDRDLCGRRLLRAGLPGRDRHRRLHEGVPQGPEEPARAEERSQGRPELGQGRAPRPRRPEVRRRDGEGDWRGRHARPDRCRPQAGQRRPDARVGREDARRRPAEAAGDRPGRGRRRVHAGLHQPDVRPLEGLRQRRLSRVERSRSRAQPSGSPGRCLLPGRQPGLDPARRRRLLLFGPVQLEGLHRRPRLQGQRDGRAAVEVDRRRRAAGGHGRDFVRLWPERLRRRGAHRGEPGPPRRDRDHRLDHLGRAAAGEASR